MIRALIFDVGGVLVHDHNPERQHYWEQRCGLPPGRLAYDFYVNPASERALLGQASEADIWTDFQVRHGLSLAEIQTLRSEWEQARRLDLELIAFIDSLHPHYKTGVISDAFKEARLKMQTAFAQQALDFQALFDVVLFSGEEGVRKPYPEIFLRALARLGVAPHEAIFVDDVPANVEGARRVGMQAIWFQGIASKDVIAEIRRRLRAQEA
jgi:epoxide hydrolase-like predicted phosphatase